jgi:predicted nuclease of predicted toxin-antitoxin system
MRLLADLHVAPRTVDFLRQLGHDVRRVTDVLPANAGDPQIIEFARSDQRVILTQDLDFSDIIALSAQSQPSLISLRLANSRIDHVNSVLAAVLPVVEADVIAGAIVAVREESIRVRRLPLK